MERITVRSSKRKEMIDITNQVRSVIRNAKIDRGICTIFAPHTTCGITINENADPSVKKDILSFLCNLVPEYSDYLHSEGNSDAHIQSSLIGHSVVVIIEGGELQLGTWQGIFLCEFDGPRVRGVWIQVNKF